MLKNLIRVGLGQTIARAPDGQGSHRQEVGVSLRPSSPQPPLTQIELPWLGWGWGWQLADATLPEGVAGTSDGDQITPSIQGGWEKETKEVRMSTSWRNRMGRLEGEGGAEKVGGGHGGVN